MKRNIIHVSGGGTAEKVGMLLQKQKGGQSRLCCLENF
jgi:hypothetical protein